MLLLHEITRADGSLEKIHLRRDGDALFLIDDAGEHALPEGAIAGVMHRYAKPLEGPVPEPLETLALPGSATLSRFRFLATYDVIAHDYIAYESPGNEPICELATAVTAALSHLARAASMRKT